MDDALLTVILDRLDGYPLPGGAAALLLAALEGEEVLRARLGGSSDAGAGRPAPGSAASEPAGAYLRSVTVRGFRGVGAAATLHIEPGPGLTLVVGRNGSGKSSFAEALEVLLTGDLKRWTEHRSASAARDGWRNLHEPGHAGISADFAVEGAARTVVRREWPAGGAFGDSTTAGAGPDRVGWGDALVTYRPFLAHTELEAFLQEPSRVYDLLLSVLGLDALTAAAKFLADARKEREAAAKAAGSRLPELCADLQAVDDERAAGCREALTRRHPDLDRVLALTAGTGGAPAGDLDRLQRLAQLTVPPEAELRTAVAELRAAAVESEEHLRSPAGQALALAGLLGAALEHHRSHGDGACPVCGTPAALTGQWRERAEAEVARLRAQAAAAEAAQARSDSALNRARELMVSPPAVMTERAVFGIDTGHAATAWTAWSAYSGSPRALADHLEERTPPLVAALTELIGHAQSELKKREDRWAPVAARVAAWARDCQEARAAAEPVPALKAAETWLKNATDDIRNARLEPLADRSRAIWSMLRQESNVTLGAIRLSGSSTRRHADVEVTVDGTPGVALGVMSQGEVNALALSIFIPRATLPASPFRFLIIDDPVQAMDPAKVDGLARVLHDVSGSRQVVVFTHDDRLATAVRRLEIPARVLEVTRRPGSVVEIRPATDPVDRQLRDATALCMDGAVPEEVAAHVVPGLCRTAVEAAFTEAIWRTQVRAGRPHAQIEASIAAARETKERAALAVFGDPARRNEVIGLLATWNRGAAATFKQLNGATHTGHKGDLRSLVDRTRFLAGLIRQRLP